LLASHHTMHCRPGEMPRPLANRPGWPRTPRAHGARTNEPDTSLRRCQARFEARFNTKEKADAEGRRLPWWRSRW